MNRSILTLCMPFVTASLLSGSLLATGCMEPVAPFTSVGESAISSSAFQPKFLKSADAIPGYYIVVLKDAMLTSVKVPELAQALAMRHGATVVRTYSHALNGFVVQTSEAGGRALAEDPSVDYVVEDGKVSGTTIQANATHGLDRIDQIHRPLDNRYNYASTGQGVNVYIIDSGIDIFHSEFTGRVFADFTAINDGAPLLDCNGHGTHVAGTVAGTTWGTAKQATLHSVRVLGCANNGAVSGVIAGIDWVTANHIKPAVANLSLGGAANAALDASVRNSISAGITYIVAAGNSFIDACFGSPGRVAEAMTVGATDASDNIASFSNWGPCIDLFAPGVGITSARNNGGSESRHGTSMASPHVSGAAALYLQNNPSAAPVSVAAALAVNAPSLVTNANQSTSTRLLYSPPARTCGILLPGQYLSRGESLSSCDGRFTLTLQFTGSLSLDASSGNLWSSASGPGGATAILQADGNFVLYRTANPALWSPSTAAFHTNTYNHTGAVLALQNDGNLVVYGPNATGPLWNSGTGGH